ncbi:MAG: hemolysin [Sandaracinus sp.]|nr:hemolysin [Sandaracinus sp.]|tara:strand:+ start:1669 stop:2814 length:1146 start_codon:yes stop_codon:yes gene_type:complete
MALLIAYILLALAFSFLCSVLEAILLSVTPAYVARMRDERPTVHARLSAMKADVDRPLAAILSLNTIAHTVGAAGAGAQAQKIWGSEILTVASAVLTLLILIFSEIIPKTLGATHWRKLAPMASFVLVWMVRLLIPLVWLSELITKVMKPGHGHGHGQVSKEEVAALARLGEEQGVFDASESRILRNLFRMGVVRTRDIMTPRTVMFALPADKTVDDVVPRASVGGKHADDTMRTATMVFSRIPVYRDSPDDVAGYVLKDELYLAAARGMGEVPVGDLVRELLVVPDALPVHELFERLLNEREHIALVVDEYGGVDGVVSMEDVLETLLGLEIVDEVDTTADMREMARRKWHERRARLGTVPPPSLALEESAEGPTREGEP